MSQDANIHLRAVKSNAVCPLRWDTRTPSPLGDWEMSDGRSSSVVAREAPYQND